jgi:hypothetical protein
MSVLSSFEARLPGLFAASDRSTNLAALGLLAVSVGAEAKRTSDTTIEIDVPEWLFKTIGRLGTGLLDESERFFGLSCANPDEQLHSRRCYRLVVPVGPSANPNNLRALANAAGVCHPCQFEE